MALYKPSVPRTIQQRTITRGGQPSTRLPSNNQSVTKRPTDYTYQDPNQNTSRYSGLLSGSLDDVYRQQAQFQTDVGKAGLEFDTNSPTRQAEAYNTRRTADADYLRAEAEYDRVNGEKPYEMGSGFLGMIDDRNAKTSYDYVKGRANDRKDLRFANQIYDQKLGIDDKYAQLDPQLALDKYIGRLEQSTRIDEATIDANARLGSTRIQQPLSAGQVLEKTRIENPNGSDLQSMATNMLGGYANNSGRSNFAYWG